MDAPPPPGAAADWQAMWTADGGLRPGQRFDISRSHPALLALLGSGELPQGTALVPGCGRGYDVGALATAQRRVTGLEASPAAVAAARAYLGLAHPTAVSAGWAVVEEGDFFAHAPPAPYDLVYDYTFLCALPPARRCEWAAQMARLVRAGGALVTLMFPLGAYPAGEPEDAVRGPPFQLSKALYAELLAGAFDLESAVDVAPDASDPRRAGLEAVAVWRRRAT